MKTNVAQTNEHQPVKVKRTILFILLTFPFFQIDYFVATTNWVGKVYTLLQLIAGIVILFLCVRSRLWKKLPSLFILFAALLFIICLASLINGDSLKRALEYSFATLLFCLLVEYGILSDIRHFLQAQMWFFGTLIVLNLITVLVFRNGMYIYVRYAECWLLGFKSGHFVYHLAFLFFTLMYAFLCDKKKLYLAYIGLALTLLSTILVKNATALFILIPFTIIMILPKILDFTKVMNILTYTGIGVALNLVLVVFRRQDLFYWLIVNILHKRPDLTYRIQIWDGALKEIREHLVIGQGYRNFFLPGTGETTHNQYMEMLYKGGIIGLIIFIIILAIVIILLFKNRKNREAKWISLFLGGFFIMFVMEQFAFSFFFFLLLFAWHCKDLVKLAEEQRKQQLEESSQIGEKSRTQKSARNFLFTIFASVTAILIGLIAQKLFIQILGLEYAGLNGLFTNVIAMLAIADLGIGEAVIFNLYKPLKDNDQETIRSLMRFYRKAFHIIALVIAVVGACMIPLLPYIAKPTEANVNITWIYLFFLADVVLSYLLSYKRAILYADQKNFYISIIHMLYLIGMNTGQLLMLYFTHNYYLYLMTKLVFRVLENIAITMLANRQYPFLNGNAVQPLDKEIRADIKKKTGALVFHKIGSFVVGGTDNILISVFFSLSTAGLYSNYYLVIDALTKLFNPALAALTPSVGNMLVSDDKEHVFQVFRRIRFMNFWIATFASTSLLILIQPFISWWFGNQYILSYAVVITLALQFFQMLMRGSYNAFQDAAGIFYENRFVPLAESAVNLIASIILLKIFGLAGVFMGTIVSSLTLWSFSYPKFVYKRLFSRSFKNYILETSGYLGIFLCVSAFSAFAVSLLNKLITAEGLLLLITDAVVCFVLINGILLLIFFKSDCLKYFLSLLKGTVFKNGEQVENT